MSDKSPSAPKFEINVGQGNTFNFFTALNYLVSGKKVRRQSWEPQDVYLIMHDDKLMIFRADTDKRLHPLTVHKDDITGEDWVIL